MPYPLGGNKYKRGPRYHAPNVDSTPPAGRSAAYYRAPGISNRIPPQVPEIFFRPTTIPEGSRHHSVGSRTYLLPSDALVKLRNGPLLWVLYQGRVHALAERGEIILTDAQQRDFDENWHKI